MKDARGIDVWMRWELDRLNAGYVVRTRSLRSLLAGETLRTRDGEPHDVDRAALERLARACRPEELDALRIPITVHFPADVADSAYVVDALAADVLHRIEGWGEAFPFREGKAWLPQSLAVDLLLRYGGALQRLML